MPTYVYECAKCAKIFEHDQRMIESALTTCLCENAGPVKRVIQPSAVMFKGSGFYVNDSVPAPTPVAEKPAEAPAPEPAAAETSSTSSDS